MSDDPVTPCEVCGAPVERVFHPVAVHFKGSGFYSTDYGRNRGAAASGSDSGSKEESKKEHRRAPSPRVVAPRARASSDSSSGPAVAIPSPTEQFFRELYDAFNARDIDRALAACTPTSTGRT